MVVSESITRCAYCGLVPPRSHGKYCGGPCARMARRARPSYSCAVCGKEFWRKKRQDDGLFCCSQRCGWTFASRRSRAAKLAKVKSRWVEFLHLYPILALLVDRSRLRRASSAARPCRVCGRSFTAHFTGGCRRKFCGKACERKAKREHQRRARRQSGKSRNQSHCQRARRLGLSSERVRRTDVFKRDGWRCQLCGRSTPRRLLRDFQHPTAPTLDHIIPMAAGGGHIWSNVQCACRECNSRKSAKPLGQTRLF